MNKSNCPGGQILRQYLLGECPDSISDEVERHVADCPSCEDTIAQFDSSTDTLMRHLPLAAAANQVSSEPAPGWIDVLRRQPPDGPGENPDRIVGRSIEPDDAQFGAQLADGFANYDVLGILGRGGMGVVFLARHKQLNRRVALKVVRPDALSSEMARRRFQREIQILGGLNHPGIVMATDAGVVGRGAYLVMEWIDGTDLGRLVRDGGPLAIESACEAGRQIAEALSAAHSGGVVHRDVKPSNAMVDATGRVRLLDFGLAHMTRLIQESGDTSVGHLLGTLDYMAPEQAGGEGQIDARSDLYALGAMLFFLLTGRPPHGSRAGRSILEHIKAVSHEEAPRVSTLRVDVAAELDELIACLLSRDPLGRPQSAMEVAAQLSRWSGGNLAARVAEFKLESHGTRTESTNSSAAHRSLVELLGEGVAEPAVSGPSATVPDRSLVPSARRRLWWWAALAPVVAIAFAAVVIMLKTPDGTLKIESEVGGVSVELVDEKDRVHGLRITAGNNNQTQLSAGEYRIRIAGLHDGLELDHEVITLRQGKDAIARITRVPEREPVTALSKSETKPERLYQGRIESDWQSQFERETEPVAKLDAARALMSLASVMPAQQQFDGILDVGDEVVKSLWIEPYFDAAFNSMGFLSGSNQGLRWTQYTVDLAKPYQKYRSELSDHLRKLTFQEIRPKLINTIIKGSDSRAAFAASLLFDRIVGPTMKSENDQSLLFLFELDVPPTGADRSAMCQLLRLSYSQIVDSTHRASLLFALLRLAPILQSTPQSRLQVMMVGRMLANANTLYEPDWPPELSEILAKLVLRRMVISPAERSGLFSPNFFGSSSQSGFTFNYPEMGGGMGGGGMGGMGGGMGGMVGMAGAPSIGPFHYAKDSIEKNRVSNRHFLNAWVKVANDYLKEHPTTSANNPATYEIVRSLDTATRIYSDRDDWPVETTAKLLTQILRRGYDDPSGNSDEKRAGQQYNLSASMVLTPLVRITGQLPDFVLKGPPKSPEIRKKLSLLQRFLKQSDKSRDETFSQIAAGIIYEAPYDALKLVCQPEFLSDDVWAELGVHSKAELLKQLANPVQWQSASGDLPIDPVLLLAILANMCGENGAQDLSIAGFFTDKTLAKSFVDPLNEILGSELQCRIPTRTLLQQMLAKSKSEELSKAIREIQGTEEITVPNVPVPAKDPKTTDSKPTAGVERLYQGRAESDWRRQFQLETELSAKLVGAEALLSFASVLPPREQLERILDIAEELLTSTMTNDYFVSAFEDATNPPSLNRNWDLSQGKRSQDYGAYQKIVNDQLRRLPAEVLAKGLSATVIKANEARAAAAALFLSYAATSKIESDPDAIQMMLDQLDVPLSGVDRSAVCQLLRLIYVHRLPQEKRREWLTTLNQLAIVLQRAPSSELKRVITGRLLSIAQDLYGPGWTPGLSKVLAQLVLGQLLGRSSLQECGFAFFSHARTIEELELSRKANQYFLDKWIEVTNEHFEAPANQPFDSVPSTVFQSIDVATRVYSDGDDWPVDRNAQLLTEILRMVYSDSPDTIPLTASRPSLNLTDLLTPIVRNSGRIPEFVSDEQMRSPLIAKRLDLFQSTLKDAQPQRLNAAIQNASRSLPYDVPYEMIRLALESDGITGEILATSALIRIPPVVAKAAAAPGAGITSVRQSDLRIDPVLLLAILADLTGKDANRDSKITAVFTEATLEVAFWGHLQTILGSSFKSRTIVQRLIRTISNNAKSERLKQTIRDLFPKAAVLPDNQNTSSTKDG